MVPEPAERRPVLIVFGYGPGISHATAARFGADGHPVALVGRTAERLANGVDRLSRLGVTATAFTCDAGDPAAVADVVSRIRHELGPVSVLLWTAFRSGDVGDVLAADPQRVPEAFGVAVVGLLTAVRACLDDLRDSPGAAVLIINGAVGEPTTEADRISTVLDIDGTALGNAAKSKLAGLLAERLRDDDVYVGEITIAGAIAGTATANAGANGQLDPADVAERLWTMTTGRRETRVRFPEAGLGLDL